MFKEIKGAKTAVAIAALALAPNGKPQQADSQVECEPFKTSADATTQVIRASFNGPAGECELDWDSLGNKAMQESLRQIVEVQKEAGYELESLVHIQKSSGNFAVVSMNNNMEAKVNIGYYDPETETYKVSEVNLGSENTVTMRHMWEVAWAEDRPILGAAFLKAGEEDALGHQYFGIFSKNDKGEVNTQLYSMPQSTQIINSGLHSFDYDNNTFFMFNVVFPGNEIKTYVINATPSRRFIQPA